MDFFGFQDQANRSTRKLIVLFVLAVGAIILSIYIAIVLLFVPPRSYEGHTGLYFVRLIANLNTSREPGVGIVEWMIDRSWWNSGLFFGVAGITTALVLGGSAFKTSQLNQGGRAVASMLGGRPVRPDTVDPDERRLLNVVEEMAIASGTAVPAVYLMEKEPGINAFAAGFSREDMVIGVTQGSLELLSRDELQGVVAHEFSHILRGDMRLNMRLLGTVFGITMISMIGYFILRFSTTGVRLDFSGSRSGARGGGGLGAGIFVLGGLLFVLGYLGVFFSNLIKSAIARQREFLADASAVQFTRNPAGLAGALKKIGGLTHGSRMRSPHAHEASHFYFANGLRRSFFQILATHPPLVQRIRRLDPNFTGEFPRIEIPAARKPAEQTPVSELVHVPPPLPPDAAGEIDPHRFLLNVGILTADQIDYAAGLREGLPDRVLEALKEPVGAGAIVIALLLSKEEPIRSLQSRRMQQDAPAALREEITQLAPVVQSLGIEMRIPLVDWAIQALRHLSDRQYERFRALTETMIAADEHIDLFEFCLQRMLRRHLDAHFLAAKHSPAKYFKIADILPEALLLLSALAWVGQRNETEASQAFEDGARQLDLSERHGLALKPRSECRDLELIDRTLERLAQAGAFVKKNVLLSCAHVVASDGLVLETERELLRAVADSLGLPVPPFVRDLIRLQQEPLRG